MIQISIAVVEALAGALGFPRRSGFLFAPEQVQGF